MIRILIALTLCYLSLHWLHSPALSQTLSQIPAVYSNLGIDDSSRLFVQTDSMRVYESFEEARYTLGRMMGNPRGTANGLAFDFDLPDFRGKLYFGLIHPNDAKHALPVYHYKAIPIDGGRAEIDIRRYLTGKYDMSGWQERGQGLLGYRVTTDEGQILYDGVIGFRGTGPFRIDTTLIEGPFLSQPGPDRMVIWFTTNLPVIATLETDGRRISDARETRRHILHIEGLRPATRYEYTVHYGSNQRHYSFRTAPEPGSRTPFTFAYASDSRAAKGGGERHFNGVNVYILKKIIALAHFRGAAFMQFTGDLISGYKKDYREIELEYANWKRAVEPWTHYMPIIPGMGNHEVVVHSFEDQNGKRRYRIERFPFETHSAEAVFARQFVNPENGPLSEDGSRYDPNPNQIDFPSYRENVFHYSYGNLAMIVLNTDYWYAPKTDQIPHTGGNVHGYIMDNQLRWLEETIRMYEADPRIDHIFVTLHTPMFPNGGHVHDDMWYHGDNSVRPYVAGKPVEQGIIERRDELLDLLVNRSPKTVAVLTGDEHNYNRLVLPAGTPDIYPDDWNQDRLILKRPFIQINNGAAGAPYYGQQETPWSGHVHGFTTQNAVVLFHVDGDKISVQVYNPDTLEEIERFQLR